MLVRGQCSTDSNYFTQRVKIFQVTRMRKPRLVQTEASRFMVMVLLKLAAAVSCHTFRAQLMKYTGTGSIQVASTTNLSKALLLK